MLEKLPLSIVVLCNMKTENKKFCLVLSSSIKSCFLVAIRSIHMFFDEYEAVLEY